MENLAAACHALVPLALSLILKETIVCAAALAAIKLFRIRIPASAFTLIAAALILGAVLAGGSALMPSASRDGGFALSLVVPRIDVPELSASSVTAPRGAGSGAAPAAVGAATVHPAPAASQPPAGAAALSAKGRVPGRGSSRNGAWIGILGAAWLAGAAAALLRAAARDASLRRALESARPCDDRAILGIARAARSEVGFRGRSELLLSPAASVPFCSGFFRASIVLPEEAPSWPAGRLKATLLHETMHAARFDNLVFATMRLVSALAWPSPLPWLSLRAAARLREEACDEAALSSGMSPVSYAAELLAAARSLSRRGSRPAPASLAGSGRLERRIVAILDWPCCAVGRGDRTRGALAIALTCLALALSVSALSVTVEPVSLAAVFDTTIGWEAVSLRSASTAAEGAAFRLERAGDRVKLRLERGGQKVEASFPAAKLPFLMPLTARPRFGVPNGRARIPEIWGAPSAIPADAANGVEPADPWAIWADRPAVVRASGAGTVRSVRLDPELGPIVEIDHGSGLATRYTMRRYGRADVAAGRRVAAGETIGELGEGLPDDLPFLEFAVLLDSGGARYSLDPSPFIFGDPAERSSPFATGVMNSAVRSDDEAQLSRLLALGIDPDGTALDHTRPLEWAVMEQNSRMARLLVAGGADPSAKTANDLGMVVEGLGLTLANTGPSLVEYAGESRNPELVAALSGT